MMMMMQDIIILYIHDPPSLFVTGSEHNRSHGRHGSFISNRASRLMNRMKRRDDEASSINKTLPPSPGTPLTP